MNFKNILIAILAVFLLFFLGYGIWAYKDWKFQTAEAARQTENLKQRITQDSLKMATQVFNDKEMGDYLNYQDPELKAKLEANNIKLSRIESIISNRFSFQDNNPKTYDFNAILAAIKSNKPGTKKFKDSSGCMVIKGNLKFENDSLTLDITDREFKNKSDGVAYWQRRQWKFLGIKTRVFGKKEFTAKVFDECGESSILRIEKQKK